MKEKQLRRHANSAEKTETKVKKKTKKKKEKKTKKNSKQKKKTSSIGLSPQAQGEQGPGTDDGETMKTPSKKKKKKKKKGKKKKKKGKKEKEKGKKEKEKREKKTDTKKTEKSRKKRKSSKPPREKDQDVVSPADAAFPDQSEPGTTEALAHPSLHVEGAPTSIDEGSTRRHRATSGRRRSRRSRSRSSSVHRPSRHRSSSHNRASKGAGGDATPASLVPSNTSAGGNNKSQKAKKRSRSRSTRKHRSRADSLPSHATTEEPHGQASSPLLVYRRYLASDSELRALQADMAATLLQPSSGDSANSSDSGSDSGRNGGGSDTKPSGVARRSRLIASAVYHPSTPPSNSRWGRADALGTRSPHHPAYPHAHQQQHWQQRQQQQRHDTASHHTRARSQPPVTARSAAATLEPGHHDQEAGSATQPATAVRGTNSNEAGPENTSRNSGLHAHHSGRRHRGRSLDALRQASPRLALARRRARLLLAGRLQLGHTTVAMQLPTDQPPDGANFAGAANSAPVSFVPRGGAARGAGTASHSKQPRHVRRRRGSGGRDLRGGTQQQQQSAHDSRARLDDGHSRPHVQNRPRAHSGRGADGASQGTGRTARKQEAVLAQHAHQLASGSTRTSRPSEKVEPLRRKRRGSISSSKSAHPRRRGSSTRASHTRRSRSTSATRHAKRPKVSRRRATSVVSSSRPVASSTPVPRSSTASHSSRVHGITTGAGTGARAEAGRNSQPQHRNGSHAWNRNRKHRRNSLHRSPHHDHGTRLSSVSSSSSLAASSTSSASSSSAPSLELSRRDRRLSSASSPTLAQATRGTRDTGVASQSHAHVRLTEPPQPVLQATSRPAKRPVRTATATTSDVTPPPQEKKSGKLRHSVTWSAASRLRVHMYEIDAPPAAVCENAATPASTQHTGHQEEPDRPSSPVEAEVSPRSMALAQQGAQRLEPGGDAAAGMSAAPSADRKLAPGTPQHFHAMVAASISRVATRALTKLRQHQPVGGARSTRSPETAQMLRILGSPGGNVTSAAPHGSGEGAHARS